MSPESVLETLEKVQFRPGDFLFQENEQSYFFYIIQKGQVEIFKTGLNGIEIPLGIVSEGQAVGEFAMVVKKPRSAAARALTDVTAVKVSESGYQSLLEELPSWALAVIEGLVERLRHTDDIIQKFSIVDQDLASQIARYRKSGS